MKDVTHLLGIDIGTSSVKVSLADAATGACLAAARWPEEEAPILSLQSGWAEQPPESWWDQLQEALRRLRTEKGGDLGAVRAIGISYQMHGLVLTDRAGAVLRNSIIWCDSRAVGIGNRAFEALGADTCLSCLLNSPGNFTASKLAWVKENEPELYARADKMMLPGDFIAQKLTGSLTTTPSALSEGILWNFKQDGLSPEVMEHFGFSRSIVPEVQPVFSIHGKVKKEVADQLGIPEGIPVSYKAGDQPNNALSLNVLRPGEVAATAGTSGVIYAVTDQLFHDPLSRVNTFAHVNHQTGTKRLGVLLCINGTGIMNSWVRRLAGGGLDYQQLNALARGIAPGSEGLMVLPFGNGAERMLENRIPGAHLLNIDLNKHSQAHVFRAVQEGIAFSFRYGLDIMRENGLQPQVIRAGKANMFLSDVFTRAFVEATGVPVELYDNDGSMGAALGAGIGAGIYRDATEAFSRLRPLERVDPQQPQLYESFYANWKVELQARLKQQGAEAPAGQTRMAAIS